MPVVLPADAFTLVDGGNGFTYTGWQDDLFDTRCFRVRGLFDLVNAAGFARQSITHDKALAKSILTECSSVWRAAYAPDQPNAWTVYGRPQIAESLASAPQVFDRALLSIAYVVRFLERAGIDVSQEQLEQLRVFPVLSTLNVANVNFYDEHVRSRPLQKEIQTAMACPSQTLCQDFFVQQKRVTKWTATIVCEALKSAGHTNALLKKSKGRRIAVANHEEEDLLDDSSASSSAAVVGDGN